VDVALAQRHNFSFQQFVPEGSPELKLEFLHVGDRARNLNSRCLLANFGWLTQNVESKARPRVIYLPQLDLDSI
jgi:hypothetical protein